MRFLMINSDYPGFLQSLYNDHPGLEERSFADQLRVRCDSLFGVADFYPRNLRDLGHEADEFHVTNMHLQLAWSQEQGLPIRSSWPLPFQPRRGRGLFRWTARWFQRILAAQIEYCRPDVIVSHAIDELPPRFWKRMRSHYRLLVGQVAAILPEKINLHHFDLMLSSLPNYVERFRNAGLKAELFRLGFDPVVLKKVPPTDPEYDVTFLGSLTSAHVERISWLEEMCKQTGTSIWGPGVDGFADDSAIRSAYQGPAWGQEMYQVLRRSRITLNSHSWISGPYANNMRLYEATGAGTLLVTDLRDNLPELFEPGREVVVYRDTRECVDVVRYYLEHEQERAAIAAAGQARTLRDHTYAVRMRELVEIVERYL